MRKVLILLLTVMASLNAINANATDLPIQLKVMTWNIEYGGNYADFSEIVKTIELANPDVLSLSEGYSSVKKLADALDMPYYDHGMQVISKYPLYEPQNSKHTYLLIEVAPQKVVALSNVHLDSDPYGPYMIIDGSPLKDVLKMENKTHIQQLKPHWNSWKKLQSANIPFFITGDLNTPSHLDWTDATVGLRYQILYPVQWPVSKKMESMGIRDTYREIFPDPVSKPGNTWFANRTQYIDQWNPDPDDTIDRIDYIYAGGPSTTLSSQLVGELGVPYVDLIKNDGHWQSDHRAVVSTFSVIPAEMPFFIATEQRFVTTGEAIKINANSKSSTGSIVLVKKGDGAKKAIQTKPFSSTLTSANFDTTNMVAGNYQALLLNENKKVIAKSFPFDVIAIDAEPSISVNKSKYLLGERIKIHYKNSTACRWDWVAIYEVDTDVEETPDDYWAYDYVTNGHSTGTLVPLVNGSLSISTKEIEGDKTYKAVLFTNEYDVIAVSAPFFVSGTRKKLL